MAKKAKYLIIGNSAGGIGAAEAIRQVDKAGAITIVSDEPCPAYCRPLISEHLADGRPLDTMLFRPSSFYETNNIRAILGRKVDSIDTTARSVWLDGGVEISWKKLLLATGGCPIVPRINGINRKGVFTFITFGDAAAISQFINGAERAVVIGGGLIGVSVTEALVRRDVKVTLIEMKERILNTILDEEASAMEADVLKQAGVEIITGHTVAEINSPRAGSELVASVTLDNGRVVPCHLVVVAIGVTPRTELVAGDGVELNRGIVVDSHMATSRPDVYACGDVAEAYDFVRGDHRLNLIWPNAYLGGRVAGFNMAGVATEYRGSTAMNTIKYFGLDIVSAGITVPPDDSYQVLSRKGNGDYRRVVLKNGRVAGMVFAGDIERSGIVFNLMKDKVDVSRFPEVLVADDFGLTCLPGEIWRPHLTVTG